MTTTTSKVHPRRLRKVRDILLQLLHLSLHVLRCKGLALMDVVKSKKSLQRGGEAVVRTPFCLKWVKDYCNTTVSGRKNPFGRRWQACWWCRSGTNLPRERERVCPTAFTANCTRRYEQRSGNTLLGSHTHWQQPRLVSILDGLFCRVVLTAADAIIQQGQPQEASATAISGIMANKRL